MEVLKKYKTQIYFHLVLNLVFGLLVTYASFAHYPLNDPKAYLLYFLHFVALQFSVFGWLYVLSINRWVFILLFPPMFLLLSVAGFWVYTQDIAISHGIIRAAAETKPDVVAELISVPLMFYILVAIACIVVLLKLHSKQQTVNPWKSPLLALAILGIICFYVMEHVKFGIFNRRLPYNIAVACNEYWHQNDLALKPISGTLQTNDNPINIVFVLGETVRADHMQLNGYARATNPMLSKRKNLISFPNTYTPMTYTSESLRQLLTDAPFGDDYSQPKYSLIDVLNHANISTNWIGNQTPEIGYEVFIRQCTTHKILDPFHSEASFRKAFDEDLIPEFLRTAKRGKQFSVLHMMGSHWWYETRYPEAFRKYRPVIKSKLISSNSAQEMVNSYDNTILYLDYFLDKLIREIEKEDSETVLIYLSDHGELLGENNQWLHAQQGKAVSNPAMLVWYSEHFAQNHPETVTRLEAIRQQKTDLDFLFPSIIGLYGIEGIPYDKNKNIFR